MRTHQYFFWYSYGFHEILYLLLWCNIRIEIQVLQALKSLCGCHGCLGRVEAAASDINVDISAPIVPNISFFFHDWKKKRSYTLVR